MRPRWAGAALVVVATACAAGPRGAVTAAITRGDVPAALDAYERLRDVDGPDADALSGVAELVLEREALSLGGDDEAERLRRALFAQLRLGGAAAEDLIFRLTAAPRLRVRVGALSLLARRHDHVRLELGAYLDDADPVVRAEALPALRPAGDIEALLTRLDDPDDAVRRAAARRLRQAPMDEAVLERLAHAVRADPAASVRAALLGALGKQGPRAFAIIHERLSDAEGSVRMAAGGALIEADPDRAVDALRGLFDAPPSREGLEAARRLVSRRRTDGARPRQTAADDPGVVSAHAYLLRALEGDEASLRGQAAVALSSSPGARYDAVLLARLDGEPSEQTRLIIAMTLLRRHTTRSPAEATLRALMQGSGMAAVQAAAALARSGDDAAVSRLLDFTRAAQPALRRSAAWSLAHAGEGDAVRHALLDEDPFVRVMTAGGMLAHTLAP